MINIAVNIYSYIIRLIIDKLLMNCSLMNCYIIA